MQLPATARRYVRFGPFTVDFVAREVRNSRGKITLQDRPFQILAMLLELPGELVTREQLRERLWPSDTFVDFDHSINTAVKKLREALENGDGRGRYIETLHKRGYRFIGTVEEVAAFNAAAASPDVGQFPVSDPELLPGRRHRRLLYLASVAAVGLFLIALRAGESTGSIRQWWNTLRGFPKPIRSLAVLPLQNLSQNPDDDYFADGLTDALITDLGNLSGLRVISHTSVMAYKNAGKPLSQITRELDVDAIIEGTVLRSGDKLRVTTQLVRASPEEHVWAERYERDVGDLISLEKQLALAIAHEVTGRLTTAEETALSSNGTTNLKAYEAYLRGRYLWKDRTSKAASGAGAYFEQALGEDPHYALAYSGLADYYAVGWGSWLNVPLARRYAQKAVELGPDLAETHASLGIVLQYQCEFAQAGAELRRAVELNPNYAMAHHWYAIHLVVMGRVQDALAENEQARRLDPFSLPINFYRTYILLNLRQYKQAMEQAEIVGAIEPVNAAHRLRAMIYWAQGQVPEAIVEEKAASGFQPVPGRPASYWDEVARVFEKRGLQAATLMALEIEELACNKPHDVRVSESLTCDPGMIAGLYHQVGDKEKTLYWLNRGIDESRKSSNGQCWVANTLETSYDDMRSDPRFREILRRLGLPENTN